MSGSEKVALSNNTLAEKVWVTPNKVVSAMKEILSYCPLKESSKKDKMLLEVVAIWPPIVRVAFTGKFAKFGLNPALRSWVPTTACIEKGVPSCSV